MVWDFQQLHWSPHLQSCQNHFFAPVNAKTINLQVNWINRTFLRSNLAKNSNDCKNATVNTCKTILPNTNELLIIDTNFQRLILFLQSIWLVRLLDPVSLPGKVLLLIWNSLSGYGVKRPVAVFTCLQKNFPSAFTSFSRKWWVKHGLFCVVFISSFDWGHFLVHRALIVCEGGLYFQVKLVRNCRLNLFELLCYIISIKTYE